MSTATHSLETPKKGKALVITVWIAQVALALMFLMTGFMKLTTEITELAKSLPWASDVPVGLVRFIGLSELLGGIGHLLPAILRVKQRLIGYAALGIATVMLFASIFHISRGETMMVPMNLAIMALAAYVAWARLTRINPAAK